MGGLAGDFSLGGGSGSSGQSGKLSVTTSRERMQEGQEQVGCRMACAAGSISDSGSGIMIVFRCGVAEFFWDNGIARIKSNQ
jgi:hypothetical protein